MRWLLPIVGLALCGCGGRHADTGQPVPPEYRLTKGIAVVLEVNRAAAQTAINLNRTTLIDAAATSEILAYCERVAGAGKSALVVIDGTAPLAERRQQVRAIFNAALSSPALQKWVQAHREDPQAVAIVAALAALQTSIELLMQEAAP